MPENVYVKLHEKSAKAWFAQLQKETIKPNAEQLRYLHDVADRCRGEARELEQYAVTTKKRQTSEPYRKALLGPPGTGNSELPSK